MRRFYAGLYDRVFEKNKSNLEKYYKALEAYICTLSTYDKMPSDSTFNEGLHYKNMYKKSRVLRYFFDIIENDNKERVDMSDLTIEHILPETLSNQWKKNLGEDKYQEIYDKYVHTLGNLSITGYNSEYSNYPFDEKKKMFKSYINEAYLTDLINSKKGELDDLYFNEWSICLKEISEEMDDDIKRYVNDITYKNELLDTPSFKIDKEKTDINAILATIGTGAILGATSGGVISIYSATLGNYAASLTLGSAIMTYIPPLLIAGTLSGAVGKVIYDKVIYDKRNREILKNIDSFVKELKVNIKEELNKDYEKLNQEIVMTTTEILKNIKGIYINKYEIENFIEEIENYISYLTKFVELSYYKV